MSGLKTIQAVYTAFGRNDPSVLFAAMDPAIHWIQAEGNPLADRNPYVGPQAVGEGVFARLLAAIDIMRVVKLEQNGYHVRTQTIPASVTPKNRLLLASPEPPIRSGQTTMDSAADGHIAGRR